MKHRLALQQLYGVCFLSSFFICFWQDLTTACGFSGLNYFQSLPKYLLQHFHLTFKSVQARYPTFLALSGWISIALIASWKYRPTTIVISLCTVPADVLFSTSSRYTIFYQMLFIQATIFYEHIFGLLLNWNELLSDPLVLKDLNRPLSSYCYMYLAVCNFFDGPTSVD